MMNFIKRLFSQPEAPPATAAPPAAKPAAAPPSALAPAPKPAPGPPLAEGDAIPIPLADIVARLPGALAPKPSASLASSFPLSVKTAMAQLPSGAVRIRFAQLRQAAAPGTFSDDPNLDETLVDLPLQKVLAAMNPAMLARRSGQAQVNVPDDVTGLFSKNLKSSARVVTTSPAPAPTPPPAPAPVVAAAPPSPPVPAPPPRPVISPIAPSPVVSAPAPSPVISPIAPAPATPAAAPRPVISPIAPGPVVAPPTPSIVLPKLAPVEKPVAPAPAPAPVAPPATVSTALTVRLSAIYEFWPEAVRQDIAQSNWNNASVSLPMDRLEAVMKTGRIAFTWGELIQWLDVPAASASASHIETSVDLPLKVIAPLFLAKRTATTPQKKIIIGDNIPNLFAGMTKVPEQAAPAPASEAASPVSVPAPVPPAPAVANVLGEVFGQPAKREWTPHEITQQINALPGVLASVMAMSDGFLVAGELPAPLKSDTVAAFLPQIFGRLSNYSGEIHLGPLDAVTLLAGKTRCMIFKAGAIYLAVVGKPGEGLPEAQLQRVAAELAERNQ